MIKSIAELPDWDDNGNISVREEKGSRYAFPRMVKVKWQVCAQRSIGDRVYPRVRRNARGAWISGASIPRGVRDFLCADSDGVIWLGPGFDFPDWDTFRGDVASADGCSLQRVKGYEEGLVFRFLATIDEPRRFTPRPGVRVSISFYEPLDGGTSDFLPYPFTKKEFLRTVQNLKYAEADLRAENGIHDDIVCPGCGEEGMEKEDDGFACMNGCGEAFSRESVMKQFGEEG